MSLDKIRVKINKIDKKVIPLLKKRMDLSIEVAKIKKEAFVEKYLQSNWQNLLTFHRNSCIISYVHLFLKENEKVSTYMPCIDFHFLTCIIKLYKVLQKDAMFFRWK